MPEPSLVPSLGRRGLPEDLASTKLRALGVVPEPILVRARGAVQRKLLKIALDKGLARTYDGYTIFYRSPTKTLKRTMKQLSQSTQFLLGR